MAERLNITLICPSLTTLAEAPTNSLRVEGFRAAQPFDVIGLELRVAFALIVTGDLAKADNSFWRRKCRELCLRPAVEPLLLAHWNKLKSFDITEPQMASFCSLLCGSKQQARTRNSYGLWDGGNERFEPAEQAKLWWSDIQAAAERKELAPLLPAYAFARTIFAHPYPDGNGRLARALVHASLAHTTDYCAPILALAPAFYLNGGKVAAALRRLTESGDWIAFNAVFERVLADAASMTQRVARGLDH